MISSCLAKVCMFVVSLHVFIMGLRGSCASFIQQVLLGDGGRFHTRTYGRNCNLGGVSVTGSVGCNNG